MQARKVWFGTLLFLALVAIPFVFATPARGAPTTLTIAIDNDEGPITPVNFNTFVGGELLNYIYEPLLIEDPTLSDVPALATDWKRSADGLTYDITLRDGVKWHDGQPFTPQDVIFSYNFIFKAGRSAGLGSMAKIEAKGTNGLTITLKKPDPFFIKSVLDKVQIFPEHIWKDQVPTSDKLVPFQGKIGTGPYMLAEISPGEFYRLTANPNYWRGKPTVDELVIKIVKDRTAQFNALKAGEIGAVGVSVPAALVGDLAASSDIKIATGPDFFNYVIHVNHDRPPFDQLAVRKAIAKAIDRKKLVETAVLGRGTVLPLGYVHPALPWYHQTADIAFDPTGAKADLDAAGIKDSNNDGVREFNGNAIDWKIICDTNNPAEVRAAGLIAGWLGDVGLKTTTKCIDIDTAVTFVWPDFNAAKGRDFDLATWGWSAVPETNRAFLNFFFNSDLTNVGWANVGDYHDPKFDAMLNEYTSTLDEKKQQDEVNAIQDYIAANLPLIPLFSPDGNFAYRPAAYDGWVYTKGLGIMPIWSFIPGFAKGSQATTAVLGGNNLVLYAVIAIVVLVVVAALYWFLRRKPAKA
jgi:peptide/nickel transport system substrate-binding protein